jgi:predicted metal-dependent peptidase
MSSKDKVVKARAALVLDEPFFGSLVLRLMLVEDSSCKTLWVDGRSLGYNPAFVDSLSMDVLKGCLCHEVMHCALSHHARRGCRDSKKWNVAGDYAVNSIIRDKFSLPDGALFNPDFSSLSAEEIYNNLPEDKGQDQQGASGSGGQDQQDSSDPGGCGEVRDVPGDGGAVPSASDMSKAESEWRVAVAQAAQQAQAFGSLPAGMDRVVNEIVNPKVDWRALLRRFMDQVSKSDYSWSPPNRRHVYSGLYLPSCRNSDLGTVVVAVDTSGSISQKALDRVMGEFSGIVLDARAETYILYCDSRVQGIEHFIDGDFPDRLSPKGGGGTAFGPVFEWVDQEGVNPACLIYFTDLDGSFPESGPMYPVLWITEDERKEVPFGEVLRI